MTPRPGLREKKNAQAKRAFFAAAMALSREKGFDATSVEEIAERAGFSRATFFNHFGSKQGVLRYYGQFLQERVEQVCAQGDPGSSPLERIFEILLAMAREADRHREDLKLLYVHSMRDPEYVARPTPARRRVLEIVSDLVGEAQKAGEARSDLSALEQAVYILSLYQSAVLAVVTGMGAAEPALRSAWRFILDGVHGDDSPAS